MDAQHVGFLLVYIVTCIAWGCAAVRMQRTVHPRHCEWWRLWGVFLSNVILFPIALPWGVWRILKR